MTIRPVLEQDASDDVRRCYRLITDGLRSSSLPSFFTYLGAFPEYLTFIIEPIVSNLTDRTFSHTVADLSDETIRSIGRVLPKSPVTSEWIQRNYHAPSFSSFQDQLFHICRVNTSLSCIFIALREAVKGWAVAAKRLSEVSRSSSHSYSPSDFSPDRFLFESYKDTWKAKAFGRHGETEQSSPTALPRVLPDGGMEKSLLPDYISRCRGEFFSEMKREAFWFLRVRLEETVLGCIHTLPHPIHSPYSMIAQLAHTYDTFPELLYLLSERFPTLAMHRMMFGAYLVVPNAT